MNSLSWVLYLMELVHSMEKFLIFIAIIIGGVFLAFNFVALFNWDCDYDKPKNSKVPWVYSAKWFSIPITLLLITMFFPSKQTMHLILASEMTEIVVMNDEVKGIANDLKDILKQQLEQFKVE
jgi:hypothetical protein